MLRVVCTLVIKGHRLFNGSIYKNQPSDRCYGCGFGESNSWYGLGVGDYELDMSQQVESMLTWDQNMTKLRWYGNGDEGYLFLTR